MLWLLQYYASGEAAWRVERGDGQKRFARAVGLGQQIERARPEWFAEPAVCFPLAAAYRSLGQARQAERFYQVQSHRGDRDAWSALRAKRAVPGRAQRPKADWPSRCFPARGPKPSHTWTAGWTIPCGSGPSRPPCKAPSTTTAIGRPR